MRKWKRRELYSELRAPPVFLVRVDGRNFSRVLQDFKKPYDLRFARAMVETCKDILREFNPAFAFTFSDEATFMMKDIFSCRVEKIDSIIASEFASRLSLRLNFPVSFDCRIIFADPSEVSDYLAWRQDEAWRNHLNSYAFYTLLEEIGDRREVQKMLKGKKSAEIHDMLHERGINLTKTPAWQRRGIMIHWKEMEFEKDFGGRTVRFKRRKVIENWEPPLFGTDKGKEYLENILKDW